VLIDFGIGKLALSALENESEENIDSEIRRASFVGKISFVGKMGYAPREQISMGICSPSSDLYALGVTAIVLLTGREPMQLMSRDSLEWEWRKYAKVSNAFAEILSKLIADLPRHRYQSAQEVLSHLKRLTRGDRLSLDSAPSSLDRERKSPHQNSIPQSHQTRSLEETYLAIPNSNPEEKNKPAPTSRERELDETVLISPQPSPQPHRALDPNFIDLCQKELAQAIGPIAHLIISEVLQQNSQISATQLADRLESYIRDPQLAKKFKQRLNFGKFPS
jgi:serine/threonine-protein kinase